MIGFLRRARVFALACARDAEGGSDNLPTVIMEAMAAGLPVVSTQVAGVPEMIEDGVTGRLLEEHDVAGLAAALGGLLKDVALARKCGAAGRGVVERKFATEGTTSELKRSAGAAGGACGRRCRRRGWTRGCCGSADGAGAEEVARLRVPPSLRDGPGIAGTRGLKRMLIIGRPSGLPPRRTVIGLSSSGRWLAVTSDPGWGLLNWSRVLPVIPAVAVVAGAGA